MCRVRMVTGDGIGEEYHLSVLTSQNRRTALPHTLDPNGNRVKKGDPVAGRLSYLK
ncbi:MAG: hypothetical protein ACM3PP_02955 [Candidatus Saccharibacteria bacterium]